MCGTTWARCAFLQVLEVNCAGDFGQDRKRIGIPFQQIHIGPNRGSVGDGNVRAVDNLRNTRGGTADVERSVGDLASGFAGAHKDFAV